MREGRGRAISLICYQQWPCATQMPGVRLLSNGNSVLSKSRESSSYLIGLFGDSNIRSDHRFSHPVVERRRVNCPAWPGVVHSDTFNSGTSVGYRDGYSTCCHNGEIVERQCIACHIKTLSNVRVKRAKVDNATLERGQATLPNLQITGRPLGFSHRLYRRVILTW